MILAIVVSLLQMLSHVLYRMLSLRNNLFLLRIATAMNHATEESISIKDMVDFDKCVSETMYN